MKRKIDHVRKLCEASDTTLETFLTARDELDLLKDKLGEAHELYESFLETEAEKEASYRWFDVKDRDFTDCRLRLCERIHSLERGSYRSEPSESLSHISDRSQSTRNSKNSRKSSSRSVSRARADAATKAARFQVEMEFLEKEHEFRRMQLAKEYALAKAEEKALKEIELECEEGDDKMKAEDDKREIKDQLKDYEVKRESNRELTTDVPPFVASLGPVFEAPQNQPHPSMDIGVALNHLVNLQTKQTELCSLLINQQKAVHLPVKEPPVFSGDSFEYPAFITAFDSIIASNVHSDKDQLFFLEKYTSGSANEAIKGYLATNSDTAYKEARKLLAQRYGNPVVVAENYKSSLRNWRQISDGDSKGLRDFSDFLVRCEEAMKTMKSMAELDSSQVLVTLSAKLPSYSGIKWCRFAHEEQTKRQGPIGFKDFVKFVKLEAELANDPVFSPNALKRERNKGANQRDRTTRPKRQNDANTGQSFVSSVTPAKPKETGRPAAPQPQIPSCPVCEGNHSVVKCHKLVNASSDERYDIFLSKGLCFRCAKSSHLSRDCPSKSTCGECGKKHHTLLHIDKPKSKDSNPQSREKPDQGKTKENRDRQPNTGIPAATANASSVSLTSLSESVVITNWKIVPVFVSHRDHPEKEAKVYALLDNASDTTFVTSKVQQALGIEGMQTELTLSTMSGKEVISVSRIDGLIAERPDRRAKVELPKTYARESIPCRENHGQIPTPEMADGWPHLKKIKDKIPKLDASDQT